MSLKKLKTCYKIEGNEEYEPFALEVREVFLTFMQHIVSAHSVFTSSIDIGCVDVSFNYTTKHRRAHTHTLTCRDREIDVYTLLTMIYI